MADRRLKRWLATEAFFRPLFLHNGQKYFVVSEIPDDAKLVRISYQHETGCWHFIFEHDSFDPVEEGHLIPLCTEILFHTNPKDFPTQEKETNFREFF
jgi:hypothetical protein